MNVAQRRPMTLREFLDWEDRQELRYEFDGLQPVAMTGGTVAHEVIGTNVVIALGSRLRGRPCRVYGSNLKIEVMGRIRYPDAFVSCTPIARDAKVLTTPVVIFEVLSESTARIDRSVKNLEYATIDSVRRYVMLEQDAVAATMFERVGNDWVGHQLSEHAIIRMPEIGIEIPLAELYDGLDFSAPLVAPAAEA